MLCRYWKARTRCKRNSSYLNPLQPQIRNGTEVSSCPFWFFDLRSCWMRRHTLGTFVVVQHVRCQPFNTGAMRVNTHANNSCTHYCCAHPACLTQVKKRSCRTGSSSSARFFGTFKGTAMISMVARLKVLDPSCPRFVSRRMPPPARLR
jgi:hypothetical protein